MYHLDAKKVENKGYLSMNDKTNNDESRITITGSVTNLDELAPTLDIDKKDDVKKSDKEEDEKKDDED